MKNPDTSVPLFLNSSSWCTGSPSALLSVKRRMHLECSLPCHCRCFPQPVLADYYYHWEDNAKHGIMDQCSFSHHVVSRKMLVVTGRSFHHGAVRNGRRKCGSTAGGLYPFLVFHDFDIAQGRDKNRSLPLGSLYMLLFGSILVFLLA